MNDAIQWFEQVRFASDAALFAFGNTLPILYAIAPLAAMLLYRKITSFAVVALIVWAAEALMREVRDPLYDFVFSESTTQDMSRLAWYGTWLILDACFVALIYISHVRLNITTSRISLVVGCFYTAFAMIQFLGYIDSYFLNSAAIDWIYTSGIPLLNTLLGAYIVAEFFIGWRNDRISR